MLPTAATPADSNQAGIRPSNICHPHTVQSYSYRTVREIRLTDGACCCMLCPSHAALVCMLRSYGCAPLHPPCRAVNSWPVAWCISTVYGFPRRGNRGTACPSRKGLESVDRTTSSRIEHLESLGSLPVRASRRLTPSFERIVSGGSARDSRSKQ